MMKAVSTISTCILTLMLASLGCYHQSAAIASKEETQLILNDIAAVQTVFRSLTPDPEGKRLAYIRADESGRALYVLNLETMQTSRITTANEVSTIYSWSPDGRYLAFSEFAPSFNDVARTKGEPWRESWLSILERDQTNYQRVTTNTLRIEGSLSSVGWLTTNSFIFSSAPVFKDYTEFFVMDWTTKTRQKVYNKLGDFVVMSHTNLACLWQNNICTSAVDPVKYPNIQPVTQFKPGGFGPLKWLRYAKVSGKFMFCGTPADSNWRYVHELEPDSGKLVRLTDEDSYNGQWIEEGKGFAYVANRDNHFSLSINTANAADKVNLFTNGAVISYIASAKGNRIFATASEGMETQGIWEYDLKDKSLRRVVDGTIRPFQKLKIVEPVEMKVKSADGTMVSVFLFRPVKQNGLKHPAIFNLPPPSSQFQKRFEENSQMFANLGYYYVSINYRGCDGYGKEYSAKDSAGVADDIMAVRKELLKNEAIESGKIILRCSSGGEAAVSQMLQTQPSLWAGAILDHPSGGMRPNSNSPPMLIFASDQDRFFSATTNMYNQGIAAKADIRLVIYTNESHSIYKTGLQMDLYQRTTEFCAEVAR